MNLAPLGFDVDHVAKIRSGISITVLNKKIHKIIAYKSDLNFGRLQLVDLDKGLEGGFSLFSGKSSHSPVFFFSSAFLCVLSGRS